MYYTPNTLKAAGMTSTSDQFGATVTIGIVKLVCTVIGSSLVDHLGRKPMLYASSFGTCVPYPHS
jgi:hypothetical protein